MIANGTGFLVFIGPVTADTRTRMILKLIGLYCLLRFSQMLQNLLDGWILQQDNDPIEFLRTKKLNILPWSSHLPDLNPIEQL